MIMNIIDNMLFVSKIKFNFIITDYIITDYINANR